MIASDKVQQSKPIRNLKFIADTESVHGGGKALERDPWLRLPVQAGSEGRRQTTKAATG
jgi:hypothetical protein